MVYNIQVIFPPRDEEPLRRTTLRTETQSAVRRRIVEGRLAAGSNVVERDLSRDLGVSRTPLREALLGLEAEGLLRSEPQRGFFVQELSAAEGRELYLLIGTLEAFALETGRPTNLDTLDEINGRFRTAAGPASAVRLDGEWHEALMAACRLPRTAATLGVLRTAAARYECRFFAGSQAVIKSARQHDQILQALRRKAYPRAATLLKQNWEQGWLWVERSLPAPDGERS